MTAVEQNARSPDRRRSRARRTMYAAMIVAALTLLVVVANAHLVYVAITSQPDCVAHVKSGVKSGPSSPGQFSAAGSAC